MYFLTNKVDFYHFKGKKGKATYHLFRFSDPIEAASR